MTTLLGELFTDRFAVTTLQHANCRDSHRIPEIIENVAAERQQFHVRQTVRAEFQKLQPRESMLLARMLQALVHNGSGYFGTPATQGLNRCQMDGFIVLTSFQ